MYEDIFIFLTLSLQGQIVLPV